MTKKIQPRRKMSVAITVLSDPYATVAQAVLVDTGLGILDGDLRPTATGAAKKEPGNVYDPVIDVDLAVGRALMKLGGQMILSGNARVRAAEQATSRSGNSRWRIAGGASRAMWLDRPAPRHAKDPPSLLQQAQDRSDSLERGKQKVRDALDNLHPVNRPRHAKPDSGRVSLLAEGIRTLRESARGGEAVPLATIRTVCGDEAASRAAYRRERRARDAT